MKEIENIKKMWGLVYDHEKGIIYQSIISVLETKQIPRKQITVKLWFNAPEKIPETIKSGNNKIAKKELIILMLKALTNYYSEKITDLTLKINSLKDIKQKYQTLF